MFGLENKMKKNTYIYTNYINGKVVTIKATDILKADELYEKRMGIHPAREPHLDLKIEK